MVKSVETQWKPKEAASTLGSREFLRLYWRVLRGLHRHPKAMQNAVDFFTVLYRRDADFVRTMRGIFEGDPEAIRELQSHFGSIELDRTTTAAKGSLKGLAERLHLGTTLSADLAQVPHLGCLSSFSLVSANRWHYALLAAHAALEIKEAHPGIGLSGRRKGGFSGLELAQSWALLMNSGHLFGTFATERAVAYVLHRDPGTRTQLLQTVDPEVRRFAIKLLDERPLYKFYEVMALVRVSNWKHGVLRTDALHAMKAYFEAGKDDPALWTYRWSRRLAYTRMHSVLGVGLSAGGRYNDLLTGLRRWPALGWAGEFEKPGDACNLIDALDSFNDHTLFSSPLAAQHVLAHLRQFRRWWSIQAVPEVERVQMLAVRPKDWPDEKISGSQTHVGRIHLVDDRAWVDEVVSWLGDPEGSVWGESNFVVTPEHQGARLHIDLYGPTAGLQPGVVHHIVRQLISEWPRNREDADFQMSAGTWMLQVMALSVLPAFRGVIQPIAAGAGASPMTLVLGSKAVVAEQLRRFVADMAHNVRQDELRALHTRIEQESHQGEWIAFVGKIKFVDTKNNDAAELDGVAGVVTSDGIRWLVLERKDGRSGGGRRQLDDFGRMLVVDASEPTVSDPGTTILRFEWRGTKS